MTPFFDDDLGPAVMADDPCEAAATRPAELLGEEVLGCADPENGGFAYTGREWDPETKLYYYRARYYDPNIARFISEDPARQNRLAPSVWADSTSVYAYVRNNPTNSADPSGLIDTRQCDKLQDKELALAAQKAEAAAGCCLPKGQDSNAWVRKIRTATYWCGGPSKDCGSGGDPLGIVTGKDLTVYDSAFAFTALNMVDVCGCLQGTVLHEIAHLMGRPDNGPQGAYAIEQGCFKCAKASGK
jgi:RHS repeat-associated protein